MLAFFFLPLKSVGRLCQRVHESGEFRTLDTVPCFHSFAFTSRKVYFISLGYIVGKFALDNMVCGWCCKCGFFCGLESISLVLPISLVSF